MIKQSDDKPESNWTKRNILGLISIAYEPLKGYMERWRIKGLVNFLKDIRIGKIILGEIRVHHILRSDMDRSLHDHPFDFYSFILGPYTEVVYKNQNENTKFNDEQVKISRRRFSITYHEASHLHRLILDKPVWTIVFASNKKRDWGFLAEKGWVYWEDYENVLPNSE